MVAIFEFSNTPDKKVNEISQPAIVVANRVVSQITGSPVQEASIDWLKVGHFIGYSLLAFSLYTAAHKTPKIHRPMIFSVLICFIYACSDEFHQLFVIGRSAEITDVFLDTSAAMIILNVVYLIKKQRKQI